MFQRLNFAVYIVLPLIFVQLGKNAVNLMLAKCLSVVSAGLVAVSVSGMVPSSTAAARDGVPDHHPGFVLGALEANIRDVLAEGASKSDVAAYYERHGFAPVWVGHPERLAALRSMLARSGEHALPAGAYDAEIITRAETAGQNLSEAAIAEINVTRLYLQFARDLNSGLLTPSDVDWEITLKPRIARADRLLQAVDFAADPMDVFDRLVPSDPAYARLVEEKKRLQAIVASGGWGPKVPAGGVLRPGRKYKAVPKLRARLAAMGYGDLGSSKHYDETLLMVVKLFQARHGLNSDGVAGPATLGALNVSAERRLDQVVVNMERLRWLNHERGDRHIFVNLADFSMKVMDHGVPSFESRVVIGKTGRDFRTPEFSHVMTHMVINPYWHVPKSIARREYLPLLKQDPMALANRGLHLYNRRGRILDTSGADFSEYSESNFPFSIKQPPGSRNALGRVKFMFPNKHNIYLHDTPAKKLFFKERRAYSHGCVRVQDPMALAEALIAPQKDDAGAYIQRLLAKSREITVNLQEPVPVHLTYRTAWIDDAGVAQYRSDVYGRDRRILAALEAAGAFGGAGG